MSFSLIFEYICVQGSIVVIAFFAYKRLKLLWKKDEANNGYGIGSSFGVILAAIGLSFCAFYANFIEHVSFVEFIINLFSDNPDVADL
ncbi:MAG: hypothetical protein JSS94_07655 [Bacteroidetes bacterium]|nr:hypothetical protein [Bacteroidota bacterium]